MFIAKSKTPLMQTFLIAYLTGFLWLRRNPLSLIFSAISPFSLLFILFIISDGKYLPLSIAGSLVMALVGYGLSLGQDISFYKNEYKIQDVFVASPVSPITYMVGLAISQILFGLPALLVLISLATLFLSSAIYFPLLIVTTFLLWASMSSMGFFLSSHMLHMRNVSQIISFVNVILSILPPVFYSIERLPVFFQYISYLVPTTHASLILQSTMGIGTPKEWSIELGLIVQVVYLIGFVFLAKVKALWRES
jgi:ABC-2 type transport system permease protein